MNLRSRSIYILLIISVVLTLITGLAIYIGEIEKNKDTQSLLHTHEVIQRAHQIFTNLLTAETNQRGYLATGNQDYLDSYKKDVNQIDSQLDSLKLMAQQPIQKQIIEKDLQRAIQDKKAKFKESVSLFEQENDKAAFAQFNTDTDRKQMDRIRSALDELIANEEHFLQQRSDQLNRSQLLYNTISYGGLFVLGITIITALIAIRRQNKEKQHRIRQLENSNKSLSDLHNREVEISNKKSEFMSMAAHDLRSPLNIISSITELIQSDQQNLTKEQKKYLIYIANAADKMAEMVNNFLDVQKIQEGQHNLIQPKNINVHDLLEAIILGFEAKANPKNIRLHFESDCQNTSFCTDKTIFTQVAENLISNAIKYSDPGTDVNVCLTSDNVGKGFLMIVVDEGLGIEEGELEHIYEPYADISTEPTGGESSTGLGLSIIKNRMDTLGGAIHCDSEINEGTTFTTYFPPLNCEDTKT